MIFSAVVFFAPDMGGMFLEHANFEPANLTATPEHIAPVWYYTPYYAILRAVPDKLWGFILFGLSVLLPIFLPWLDRSRVRSIRYRGWMYKTALSIFVVTFIIAGMAWIAACDRHLCITGANLCSTLFRVLPANAFLYGRGQDEAGAGQGGLPWVNSRRSPH